MQFKVPKDVQRADNIIGPLTLKQLIILAAGGGTAYAIYTGLSVNYYIEVWLLPVLLVSIITLCFAFVKPNGRDFERFLMDAILYNFLPKKRKWIQGTGVPFIPPFKETEKKQVNTVKKVKEQRNIQEISSILDSGGKSGLSKQTDLFVDPNNKEQNKEDIKK